MKKLAAYLSIGVTMSCVALVALPAGARADDEPLARDYGDDSAARAKRRLQQQETDMSGLYSKGADCRMAKGFASYLVTTIDTISLIIPDSDRLVSDAHSKFAAGDISVGDLAQIGMKAAVMKSEVNALNLRAVRLSNAVLDKLVTLCESE